MGQQIVNAARRLGRQSLKDVFEVGVGVVPVDARRVQQAHHRSAPLARTQTAGK